MISSWKKFKLVVKLFIFVMLQITLAIQERICYFVLEFEACVSVSHPITHSDYQCTNIPSNACPPHKPI